MPYVKNRAEGLFTAFLCLKHPLHSPEKKGALERAKGLLQFLQRACMYNTARHREGAKRGQKGGSPWVSRGRRLAQPRGHQPHLLHPLPEDYAAYVAEEGFPVEPRFLSRGQSGEIAARLPCNAHDNQTSGGQVQGKGGDMRQFA